MDEPKKPKESPPPSAIDYFENKMRLISTLLLTCRPPGDVQRTSHQPTAGGDTQPKRKGQQRVQEEVRSMSTLDNGI